MTKKEIELIGISSKQWLVWGKYACNQPKESHWVRGNAPAIDNYKTKKDDLFRNSSKKGMGDGNMLAIKQKKVIVILY